MKKRIRPLPINKGQRTRARQSDSTPAEAKKAAFSLQCNDKAFCLANCESKDKVGFADKIHTLSSLTWNQIICSGRHGAGYEKIDRQSIKKRIPEFVTEDVDIIAFRYKDKKAMVGYRDQNGVFQILWFDSKFKLYDHG